MKKHFLFVAMLLSLTVIFVGCSQQSADKPPTSQTEKDLTLNELVTKSEETMAKNNGYRYNVHLTQNISAQGNETATDMNFDIKMTETPKAQYWNGKVSVLGAFGKVISVEMYRIDNMIYKHVVKNPWIKVTRNNIDGPSAMGDGPVDTIKQLSKIAKSLGENKGITMKKENGSYLVTMNHAVLKNSKDYYNQILQGMKDESKGANIDFSKVKIVKFKQVYYIDEKTFELKSVENQSNIDVPIQGQTITIDQKVNITVNGPYNGKINLPADLMNQLKNS